MTTRIRQRTRRFKLTARSAIIGMLAKQDPYRSYTPNIIKRAVVFSRFYAAGRVSDRLTLSICSQLPGVLKDLQREGLIERRRNGRIFTHLVARLEFLERLTRGGVISRHGRTIKCLARSLEHQSRASNRRP